MGGGALGVADGVGGWAESGVNPAEYSQTLMEMARQYLEGDESMAATSEEGRDGPSMGSGQWLDAPPGMNPVNSVDVYSSPWETTAAGVTERTALKALAVAHKLTRKPGSATACVLRLDQQSGELEGVNLGDSGFLIIRGGEIVFQSEPQQHFFDCPFQLGCAPEFTSASDSVEDDAAVYRVPLQLGDVIVLATDGLLDNVWPADIAALAPRSAAEVQSTADALASLALRHGTDPEFESPYAVEAAAEGIDLPIWEKLAKVSFSGGKLELGKFRGGKLDDVTVVVGLVEETAVEEPLETTPKY